MVALSNLEKTIRDKYLGEEKSLPLAITDEGIISLDYKLIKDKNMQVPGNDFEGWAIAAHICSQMGQITLDIKDVDRLPDGKYVGNGHVNRFLYRAMKFKEQYSWFHLSDKLNDKVDRFKKYLDEDNKIFVNNIATKQAGNTYKIYDENAVEAEMAKPGLLKNIVNVVGDGDVYRQLPVGLFEGKKARDTAIFTYGKSAIDLWSINGDTINIIELKTKNPMLGIVTEIFFYSNYIYDFIMNGHGFTLNGIPRVSDESYLRGYDKLFQSKDKLKRVNGIMLADDEKNFHAVVEDPKCIDILNDNKNCNITYIKEKYHFDISVGGHRL